MPRTRTSGVKGNNYWRKHFENNPEALEAYKEKMRAAQKKFIAEHPERFKEIQKMGNKKNTELRMEKRKRRLKEQAAYTAEQDHKQFEMFFQMVDEFFNEEDTTSDT